MARPFKEFKDKYCEMLIKHMSQGYSFESFGALVDGIVGRDTLYNWLKKYPEFAKAREKADVKSRVFWEKLAIKNIKHSKGTVFETAVWIFNMRNRFGWRDNPEKPEDKEKDQSITVNVNFDV